jgi:hypothetical protein
MKRRKCVIGKAINKQTNTHTLFIRLTVRSNARTTNVNCSGKTLPIQQGKTSFCTNRADGRHASNTYCNAFHHCIGGVDHLVRCTGELQWDDRRKECGWESTVHCGPPKKMLPNDMKTNSTFCTGRTDG